MKRAETFTIKVLRSTIDALNMIAVIKNELQYETADRIAKQELAKVTMATKKKKK